MADNGAQTAGVDGSGTIGFGAFGPAAVAQKQAINAATDAQMDELRQLQTVTHTTSTLAMNTLTALKEFRGKSGAVEFPEFDAKIKEFLEVSERLSNIDANDFDAEAVSRDTALFDELQHEVSAMREEVSQEKLGGVKFSNILKEWQNTNNELTIQGGRLQETVDKYQSEFGKTIGKAFEDTTQAIANNQVVSDLSKSLPMALAGPLGPLVAAFDEIIGIDKVIAGGTGLFKKLFAKDDEESDFEAGFFTKMGIIMGVGKKVNTPAQGLLPKLIDGIEEAQTNGADDDDGGDGGEAKAKKTQGRIGSIFKTLLMIPVIIGTILSGLAIGTMLGNFLKEQIDKAIQWFTGDPDATLGTALYDFIHTTVPEAWENLKQTLSDGWESVKSTISGWADSAIEIFQGVFTSISEAMIGFVDEYLITPVMDGLKESIIEPVTEFIDEIKNMVLEKAPFLAPLFGDSEAQTSSTEDESPAVALGYEEPSVGGFLQSLNPFGGDASDQIQDVPTSQMGTDAEVSAQKKETQQLRAELNAQQAEKAGGNNTAIVQRESNDLSKVNEDTSLGLFMTAG